MKNKLPDFYNEDPEELVNKKELKLSLNEEIAFLTRRRDELEKEIKEIKEKRDEVYLGSVPDEVIFTPTPNPINIANSTFFRFGGGQSGGGGSSNSW